MTSENASAAPAAQDEAVVHSGSVRGTAGFIAGALFGAFLGAAFALLFAPDRGEKTRGRMRKRIRSLREDALEGIDRAGTRTRKELRRRRQRLQAELERARGRA